MKASSSGEAGHRRGVGRVADHDPAPARGRPRLSLHGGEDGRAERGAAHAREHDRVLVDAVGEAPEPARLVQHLPR